MTDDLSIAGATVWLDRLYDTGPSNNLVIPSYCPSFSSPSPLLEKLNLTLPQSWYLIISAQGGPTSLVSLTPPTSTSYTHRSQLFEWQFVTGVASSSSPFPIQQAYSFLNPMIAEIENAEGKEESGMYYNYADSALSADEAHKRYWLGNYEKLARIKGMLDPGEVFMSPQSVNSDWGCAIISNS